MQFTLSDEPLREHTTDGAVFGLFILQNYISQTITSEVICEEMTEVIRVVAGYELNYMYVGN